MIQTAAMIASAQSIITAQALVDSVAFDLLFLAKALPNHFLQQVLGQVVVDAMLALEAGQPTHPDQQ